MSEIKQLFDEAHAAYIDFSEKYMKLMLAIERLNSDTRFGATPSSTPPASPPPREALPPAPLWPAGESPGLLRHRLGVAHLFTDTPPGESSRSATTSPSPPNSVLPLKRSRRTTWTSEQVTRLVDSLREHPQEKWEFHASRVGDGKTAQQCLNKYKNIQTEQRVRESSYRVSESGSSVEL